MKSPAGVVFFKDTYVVQMLRRAVVGAVVIEMRLLLLESLETTDADRAMIAGPLPGAAGALHRDQWYGIYTMVSDRRCPGREVSGRLS